jgi:uncharacterized protein
MQLVSINSPGAAFLAGLVTSLHCVGMCGPLACSLMPSKGKPGDPETIATVYHTSRLTAYALLGGLAGGLCVVPLTWMSESYTKWIPWLLVLFFLALAFGLERKLPRPQFLNRLSLSLYTWIRGKSAIRAAAILGFFTPLLPCGPLYFLLAIALVSGSALKGVEFMVTFGLGTIPLVWLTQFQFNRIRQALSPLWFNRARILLALSIALIISWRLRSTLGFIGPSVKNFVCF